MIQSAEEFVALRAARDRRAATDAAPDAVWLDLLDRFPDERKWVAFNRTIGGDVLRRLAVDPDPDVRWMIATNPRTPPGILELLLDDDDSRIRDAVWERVK